MKLYLDVIFITNFIFDFILLVCVSIVLKKNSKLIRMFLGALFGSITMLSLFIKMSSIELFMLKIIMSLGMILIAFPYKSLKVFLKDVLYLYIISIFCGGGVYFLYNQLGYKHEGLIFIKSGYHYNFILLIIFFILFVYIYIKQAKNLKVRSSNYHTVTIYYQDKKIKLNAYLDTGNRLYDPFNHRCVSLLYTNKPILIEKPIYIPYKTVNKTGVILCFLVKKIVIDKNKEYKNQMIGIINDKCMIPGVDLILHNDLEG